MKKKITLKYTFVTYLTLLVLFILPAKGQEREQQEFLLLNANSKETIARAHVINQTSRRAVLSKDNGLFKLNVQHGDSLLITAVGYKPMYISVDSSSLYTDELNHLFMEVEYYAIKEVKIYPFGDYEKLKYDIKNLRIDNSQEELLQRNIQAMAIKEAVAAMAPPSGLVMRFKTKEEKRKEHLDRLIKESNEYFAMREKLPDDMVKRITGLKGDSLQLFINEFLMQDHINEEVLEYDLITELKDYFEEYRAR